MPHFSRSLLVACAATMLFAPAALAADKSEPLWHAACAKEGDKASCSVEQFAIAQPKNVPVLHVRFQPQDSGKADLAVTVPLGVLLPPGLQLVMDGAKPITLPFERCTGLGCNAVAVLDQTALQKFEKGKTLIVRYAVSDKASADIPIKLEGLADALQSLSK